MTSKTCRLALIATLLLAACERNPAGLAARDHSASVAPPPAETPADQASGDPRDAPIPKLDGKPIWTANASNTAEENARSHFERNGEAFGVSSMDAYVAKAHDFTSHPPRGAETITRKSNGDTLIYDPAENIFAVVTKAGAPRTMFKPDNGAEYWEQQKAIEAGRE